MKKILIIGVIALAVVGCVLAAGCTSTTTNTPATTTEDFAVGTWSTDDGKTSVVLTNDFKGIYIDGDNETSITWKKTAENTYEITNANGSKTTMTMDKINGILTNAAGNVLTKKLDGTSGIVKWIKLKEL